MTNRPYIIGVDVASQKADVHVHGPEDEELGHFVMKATNSHMRQTLSRLQSLVDKRNTVVVLEATAIYHRIYYYAFVNCGFEVVVVNPYQSHAFQSGLSIRKTRTDKVSAHTLAVLYRTVRNLPPTKGDTYLELRKLVRAYYRLMDEQSDYRRRILTVLAELFPLLAQRFKNLFSLTGLAILRHFPTPQAILEANPKDLFYFIRKVSRQRPEWAIQKLDQLLSIARESPSVPVAVGANIQLLHLYLDCLEHSKRQADRLRAQLEAMAQRCRPAKLLLTIPGIGTILATTIVAEIENIENFKKPAHLAAFAGIDPTVKESGNFKGTRNHMSKRGSKLLRRALYLATVAAIRRDKRTGLSKNPYLREYYDKKVRQGKPKKVALGACMQKTLCYVFTTLKHDRPFRLIDPQQAAWRKVA